jgi:hypothetical protein
MGNLKNVVYLSRKNYQDLIKNGQVTVNGVTVFYSDDDIHITPLDRETLTEEEKQKACELIGAASVEYVDEQIEKIQSGGAVSGLSGLYEHKITIHGVDDNGNEGDFVIKFFDTSDVEYTDYDEEYRFQGLEQAISKSINPLLVDEELLFLAFQFLRVVDFFVDPDGNGYYFTDIYGEEYKFNDMIRLDYEIKGA